MKTSVKFRYVTLLGAFCVMALGGIPRIAMGDTPEETALTFRLRPVPRTLLPPARDRLVTTLSQLIDKRKSLNAELEGYFAMYGTQISPQSPQYQAFLDKRKDLISANEQLLAEMRIYNQETLEALDKYIVQLDAEIRQTRAGLLALQKSFVSEGKAFSDLADMNHMERNTLLDALRSRVVESGFIAGEAGVEKALEGAVSITPRNAEKIIDQFKRAGADNSDLFDLVKAIGETKDKQARLIAGKRLYKMLKDERTIWKLNELADQEEYLAALIEVVSWVSPSPWLKVCAESLFDSARANLAVWFVLGPAESTLSAATKDQLRHLKLIGDRFVTLIQARKEAQEDLRSPD